MALTPTLDTILEAVKAGDLAQVQAVLAADPALAAARDAQSVSALLHAQYRGRADIVALLRAAAPALDVFEASALGDIERLRALLDADPALANTWAGDGFFPLGLAAFFGHPGAVRLLLERGADVHATARNAMKVTALHAAAAARVHRTETSRLLLDHGARVDARQEGGWTALHAAAQSGDVALVTLLLARGADRALANDYGKTAASLAKEKGHTGVLKLVT